MAAGYAAGICTDKDSPERSTAIAARVHPDVANKDNEVDKLVVERPAHRAADAHLEPR